MTFRNLLPITASAIAWAAAAGNWQPLQAAESHPANAAVIRLNHAPKTPAEKELPIVIWSVIRKDPKPMAIHVLRVDLTAPELEVVSMLADDPDAKGPAEAVLEDPVKLASRLRALAAINANAFGRLPQSTGAAGHDWQIGLPVEIIGAAVHGGRMRSGPCKERGNELSFWTDDSMGGHIGPFPVAPAAVREAVNSFCGELVAGGRVLPRPGGDRHPRTAVGIDARGRWLFCVVVDGRQPGYSAGMTMRELADFMAGLPCRRAINLDGGGSSILLAANPRGKLEVANRPSDSPRRPLPILLGVRMREDSPRSASPQLR
jgi:hypothetical protein